MRPARRPCSLLPVRCDGDQDFALRPSTAISPSTRTRDQCRPTRCMSERAGHCATKFESRFAATPRGGEDHPCDSHAALTATSLNVLASEQAAAPLSKVEGVWESRSIPLPQERNPSRDKRWAKPSWASPRLRPNWGSECATSEPAHGLA